MSISTETHDIGRFFWHTIRLEKGSPFFHRHPTHEIDPPYRFSNSLLIRMPFTSYGIVLGWWHTVARTEEQAILAGMSGRELGSTIVPRKTRDSILKVITSQTTHHEEAMEMARMLGVS